MPPGPRLVKEHVWWKECPMSLTESTITTCIGTAQFTSKMVVTSTPSMITRYGLWYYYLIIVNEIQWHYAKVGESVRLCSFHNQKYAYT
jgi:hypothetical protein